MRWKYVLLLLSLLLFVGVTSASYNYYNDTETIARHINNSEFESNASCIDENWGTNAYVTRVGGAGTESQMYAYSYENYSLPIVFNEGNLSVRYGIVKENTCTASFVITCWGGSSWVVIHSQSTSLADSGVVYYDIDDSCLYENNLALSFGLLTRDPDAGGGCDGDDEMNVYYWESAINMSVTEINLTFFSDGGTQIHPNCEDENNVQFTNTYDSDNNNFTMTCTLDGYEDLDEMVFWSNGTNQNFTMNSSKLILDFVQEGVAFNVSGYVTDYNYSYTFYNQSYLKDKNSFSDGIVYARFLKSPYDGNMTKWINKSQFYEYDNSVPYAVMDTIEIFSVIDTSSYFQTQDNAGNIIKSATLRLYGTIPANVSGTNSSYAFYGQRITNNNGITVFALDSEAELYVTASATGYQTRTVRLTASEVTTFTADDPLIIRLERSAYTQKDNIFVSDLWKINGTKVFPSRFDDLSSDYFMFIYDYFERTLQYSTSYEGINRTIDLDDTTKTGVITLDSGEQFSSTDNSTWYIYIYGDEELVYTIGVTYGSIGETIIFDVVEEGLDTNNAWKVVVFMVLVIISSIMGLIFRTPEEEVGVNTFFIGGFISALAVTGMGWLAIIGVFHYLGKLIKKWVSE